MSRDNLGRTGVDRVTGFAGTITSRVEYLTGCSQYGITPRVDKDGKTQDTNYFDIHRVEVTGEGIDPKTVKSQEEPGGPNRDAPGN